MANQIKDYCSICPYKAGDFTVAVHRKFIHGNLYLEKLVMRVMLELDKEKVFLTSDNNFHEEVNVTSNTTWTLV